MVTFLIAASQSAKIAGNGSNWGMQQLAGHDQIWAPEIVFIGTVCLDVFIFIFFLAGIDTSVDFFEENPNVAKHLVRKIQQFELKQSFHFDSS